MKGLWKDIYNDLSKPNTWDKEFYSGNEAYFDFILQLDNNVGVYIPLRKAQILFRRRQFQYGLDLIKNVDHPIAHILNRIALIDNNKIEGLEIDLEDYVSCPEALCMANHNKSILLSMRGEVFPALERLATAFRIANYLGMENKNITFVIEQKRQECLLGKYDSQFIESKLDSIKNKRISEFAHETIAEIHLCRGDFKIADYHARKSGTPDLQLLIQLLISPNSVPIDVHRELSIRLALLYEPLKSFLPIVKTHLSIRESGALAISEPEYIAGSNKTTT